MKILKQKVALVLIIGVSAVGLISYQGAAEYMTTVFKPAKIAEFNVITGEVKLKNSADIEDKVDKKIDRDVIIDQVVNYAGRKIPTSLVNLYKNVSLSETVLDVTKKIDKMILEGDVSGTEMEKVLRDIFSTAATDTGTFASDLLQKYNLTNVATTILKDPQNTKAIKEAIGDEIEAYAKQELNKLANQAIGAIFPVLQNVQIDFTNLNSKTLKSTLRSAIVNALAQSYLGPQYVALYMAVSTVCPPCMQKVHAELRRFDKNYIQPATDSIADEWDNLEDRLKAESKRIGEQTSAELKRLKERISNQFNKQIEHIINGANRAKEKMEAELQKIRDSKVVVEITRQLNDIQNEAVRAIDRAATELQREWTDAINEGKKISKRIAKELDRQVGEAKNELQSISKRVKNEIKQQVSQVSNEAKRLKDRIEAELKRAADKVKAEAERLKDKAKNFTKKIKKKLRF